MYPIRSCLLSPFSSWAHPGMAFFIRLCAYVHADPAVVLVALRLVPRAHCTVLQLMSVRPLWQCADDQDHRWSGRGRPLASPGQALSQWHGGRVLISLPIWTDCMRAQVKPVNQPCVLPVRSSSWPHCRHNCNCTAGVQPTAQTLCKDGKIRVDLRQAHLVSACPQQNPSKSSRHQPP